MSVKSFAEAVTENVTRYTRRFGIEQAEAEETEFALKTVVNVKEYGAKGDGVTDDTAPILAAVASMGGTGTLYLPSGKYITSARLSFDSTQAFVVKGTGGISGNGGASVIKYTGESAPSIVSARSSIGFALEDIGVAYNNGAFKGPIVDFSALGTVGEAAGRGEDTAQASINRCYIGSFGHLKAAQQAVLLDNSNQIKVRDSFLGSSKVGVLGRASLNTHAVNVSFNGVQFLENELAHIKNAGGGWSIIGSAFEGSTEYAPFVYTYDANVFSKGMAIIGNWMGDAGAGQKQVQIDWGGSGLVVEGNLIGGQKEAGSIGVLLRSNGAHGIIIRGNCFEGLGVGVAAQAEGLAYFDETGNDFINVTTPIEEPATGFGGTAVVQGSGGSAIQNYHTKISVSSVGFGFSVKEGENAKQGISGAMVLGEVTVPNTAIGASSRLLLTRQAGGTNPGSVYEATRTNGTSFVVKSTNALDTGTVAYQIFEPA
jgi:hypothetical protein